MHKISKEQAQYIAQVADKYFVSTDNSLLNFKQIIEILNICCTDDNGQVCDDYNDS